MAVAEVEAVDAIMTMAACSLTVTRPLSRWDAGVRAGLLTVKGAGVDPPEDTSRWQHGMHGIAESKGQDE